MEEKKEKKQTTIDEDEKQFADLLFGDLQEITPQVTNWIINYKIEYKRRKARNSTRETTSLAWWWWWYDSNLIKKSNKI